VFEKCVDKLSNVSSPQHTSTKLCLLAAARRAVDMQNFSEVIYAVNLYSSELTIQKFAACWRLQGERLTFAGVAPAHVLVDSGWRRLIGSPKLQIIFHKRVTKYRSLVRKMTYKDKGSYESAPPCSGGLYSTLSQLNEFSKARSELTF